MSLKSEQKKKKHLLDINNKRPKVNLLLSHLKKMRVLPVSVKLELSFLYESFYLSVKSFR
jgi:hypothetical protein